MEDPNMPNDKHEAKIYLDARKQILIDVLREVSKHRLYNENQISGLMWNKIEEIDELLENY